MKITFLMIILFFSHKSWSQSSITSLERDEGIQLEKAEFDNLQTAILNPNKSVGIKALSKYIDSQIRKNKNSPVLFKDTVVTSDVKCPTCPSYLKLTESINEILQNMKSDPTISSQDDLPVSINKLNLLFYVEKSRQLDGSVTCKRFLDQTPNLIPTSFPGTSELMLESVMSFGSVSQMQLIDPNKEEVLYYYRGEGEERNIIVEAKMTREGGRLRYFYYRPAIAEANPYNLPNLGEEEKDVTLKKKTPQMPPLANNTAEDLEAEKKKRDSLNLAKKQDKISYEIDPKVVMRNKYIPKNVHLASGSLSQSISETGLSVNGVSQLTLTGNKAQLNLTNDQGYNYAILDLNTSLSGKSTRTIIVPFEVNLGNQSVGSQSNGEEGGPKLSGHFEDSNNHSLATFSLTDRTTSYFRTEYKRLKHSATSTFAIAKDFIIGKNEVVSVAVGRNETTANYASLQHRKALSDNVTMVLDVRYDTDKKAMLMYQVRAQF